VTSLDKGSSSQDRVAVDSSKSANAEAKPMFCDPLLSCLLHITKLENTPCSETSLVAGLPLVEEKLTPELFIRAAGRAGLQAKMTQRELLDIPKLVLPATLLLKNNRAVVLLSYDTDKRQATIVEPRSGDQKLIAIDTLLTAYTGYVIYTRSAYHIDEDIAALSSSSSASSGNNDEGQKSEWFWSVMRSSWRIYRDVLLASITRLRLYGC